MLVVELLLMIALKFPQLIIQGHLMVVDQVAIYLVDMSVLQELMEQVVAALEMDGMVILKQMHLEVLVDRVLL